MRSIGLIQTASLGDIFIAAPIAKYYADRGFTVYWPVDSAYIEFLSIGFPYINFLSVDPNQFARYSETYFIKEPQRLLAEKGVDEVFHLYYYLGEYEFIDKRLAACLKMDEYKYQKARVPFSEKWKLCINRDYQREKLLFDSLYPGEPYAILNELSGDKKPRQIVLHESIIEKYPVIRFSEMTASPFDWITLFMNASLIISVEGGISNLVEQLNIKCEKMLFLKAEVAGLCIPVYRNGWVIKSF